MTASLARPTHRLPASQVLGHDIAAAESVDDALKIAHLDWGLVEHPAENIMVMTPDGMISTHIPGQRLIMRDDSHLTLASVGGRYEPVDNAAAFALADAAHNLGATFAHAGELDHGRRTFMTMDLPDARVAVGGHDLVDFGVVFRTSHAGTGSIVGEVTGKRLVCTNGMTVGIGSAASWAIPHTASALGRMQAAKAILQGAARYAKSFAAVAETLISAPMSRSEFTAYIDALYPKPDEAKASAVTRWENRRRDLFQLFQVADTQSEGRSTAWGAFNAVVEWEDWSRSVRPGAGATADQARAARQFTTSDASGVKQNAFSMAMASA